MSTKTTFKRIALVAVASMGFGVLTSVAPAIAGPVAAASVTAGTFTTTNPSGRTGVTYTGTVVWTVATGNTNDDTVTTAVAVVNAPAGSTAAPTQTVTAGVGTDGVSGGVFTMNGTSGGTATSTISFTPDVAGSYTLIAYNDRDENGMLSAGEASSTRTISVVSGADPVTATFTRYNTTAATGLTGNGALVRIALTNSAGAAASLGNFESLTAAVSAGRVYKVNNGTSNADAASVTLVRGSFNSSGRAYLNLTADAAASQVLTLVGTNGAALSGISLSATTTFAVAAGAIATALAVPATVTTGIKVDTAQVLATTAGAWSVDPLKTTTVSVATTAAANAVVPYTITQGATGDLFGTTTQYAFTSYVTATSAGVVSISAPAFTPLAATNSYEIGVGPTVGNNKITVTATASPTAAAADVTRDQASTLRVAPGAPVTLSAVWKDGFGIVAANQPVSVSITSGRNAHVTTQNSVTDAAGRVTFTYTDAPLAGVTATVDTVTFNGPSSADVAYTINWAAVVVGAVAITTPDTTAGVNNTIKATPSGINAGSSGASGSTVGISAVVTDANGAVYAGIPVTFTVSGTTAAILSTRVTTYTDATGTALSNVYAWATGTYTITATAGGKTSTGLISFASTTPENARIVSATVAGNVVTGMVVDRYGNPVSGVTLYASTTSPANIGGLFVSGSQTTSAAGTISWVVTGAGDVTVSAVNPSSPAGTTFGQTCAAAARVSCAATATALLAATVGTSTTAETNVGNSFAPAGVSSATVTVVADTSAATKAAADKASTDAAIAALKAQLDAAAAKAAADKASSDAAIAAAQAAAVAASKAAQDAAVAAAEAAADAAAEATDAANAATDAANASAEAGDAATAAAQDAADAVAALSTQVSEMIDTLKKQITALTNLVIKIQKKVKA